MAIFRKKKDEEPKGALAAPNGAAAAPGGRAGGASGGAPQDEGRIEFSPEKSRKFFERAQTVHDATNYEYAMSLWLQGLRHNPLDVNALASFFASAAAFNADPGTKRVGKDTQKEFAEKGDLNRWLATLLDWGVRPTDAFLGVRSAQHAQKLGLRESAVWLAERAVSVASREKRPRKEHFVNLMEVFRECEAYERAVQAGEVAVRLDPADGKLAALVRNISAESTMSKGGFHETGQVGGFRSNVRDSTTQRRLEEESRFVRTEETVDRLVQQARADYESRPEDGAAITKYAKLLLDRGTPQDEKTAFDLYKAAHQRTSEFRFWDMASQVMIRQARRRVAATKEEAGAPGAPPEARERHEQAVSRLTELQLRAAEAAVEAYPTDLARRYELGKMYFESRKHNEAIEMFQIAKDDPRNRQRSLNYLGLAFHAIGWYDEAIETFRQAVGAHGDVGDAMGMELRYGLLISLQARAEQNRDISDVEEADKLASAIAIHQMSYRDVRDRRDAIKRLMSELRRGGAAAS